MSVHSCKMANLNFDPGGDADVEDSILELLPRLQSGCSVRDSITRVVRDGLGADLTNYQKKTIAVQILTNSINAHFGNVSQIDKEAKILPLEALKTFLPSHLLETLVFNQLLQGLYPRPLLEASIKFVHAICHNLSLEDYPCVFDHSMQRFLLSLAIEASASTTVKVTLWPIFMAIFTILVNAKKVSFDFASQMVSCIFAIVDEAAITLCHAISSAILVPRLAAPTSYSVVYGFDKEHGIRLCKRCVAYFTLVLSSTDDKHLLSLALHGLAGICEVCSGIEILLESSSLDVILKLTLVVVDRYNQINQRVGRFTSNREILQSITSQLHDLSFDALSVLSKIAYNANRSQITKTIDMGVPETLVKLLECPVSSDAAKTRSCNTLGNIGCETDAQVQAIIDADAFPIMIRLFDMDPDVNTKIEAAYAICACISRADRRQVGYIISATSKCNHIGDGLCMAMIGNMLDFICRSDPGNLGSIKLCKIILCAIDNILKHGICEQLIYKLCENPYCKMFSDIGGDAKLAKIGFFPDYNIATKSIEILQKYYNKPKIWAHYKPVENIGT